MTQSWSWLVAFSGFAAGFGLHAWSPWDSAEADILQSAPLVELTQREVANDKKFKEYTAGSRSIIDFKRGYDALISDKDFEKEAARFLAEQAPEFPVTATESLLAVVILHDRYGAHRALAGCETAAYADRYIYAEAMLTDQLLKDSPIEHRIRVTALRRALDELNQREAGYACSTQSSSGCGRDRRIEHMKVVDALSRWAFRLASQPGPANPESLKALKRSYLALADAEVSLKKEYASRPDYLEMVLKRRLGVLEALDNLSSELKGWPPEVAEDLAPLVLRTFQD